MKNQIKNARYLGMAVLLAVLGMGFVERLHAAPNEETKKPSILLIRLHRDVHKQSINYSWIPERFGVNPWDARKI